MNYVSVKKCLMQRAACNTLYKTFFERNIIPTFYQHKKKSFVFTNYWLIAEPLQLEIYQHRSRLAYVPTQYVLFSNRIFEVNTLTRTCTTPGWSESVMSAYHIKSFSFLSRRLNCKILVALLQSTKETDTLLFLIKQKLSIHLYSAVLLRGSCRDLQWVQTATIALSFSGITDLVGRIQRYSKLSTKTKYFLYILPLATWKSCYAIHFYKSKDQWVKLTPLQKLLCHTYKYQLYNKMIFVCLFHSVVFCENKILTIKAGTKIKH